MGKPSRRNQAIYVDERLMTLSTSAVARCCWSAASRSRVSRATFVPSRTADDLREGAVGARRLLRAPVLRRCALVCSPPALERRRIAAPRLRTRHRGKIQTSTPGDGSSQFEWAGVRLKTRRGHMNYDALLNSFSPSCCRLMRGSRLSRAGGIERDIENGRATRYGNLQRADDNPRVLEAELETHRAGQGRARRASPR